MSDKDGIESGMDALIWLNQEIERLEAKNKSLEAELEQWRSSPVQNSTAVIADFERYVLQLKKKTAYDGVACKHHDYTLQTIKRYEYRVMGGECCKEFECTTCEVEK